MGLNARVKVKTIVVRLKGLKHRTPWIFADVLTFVLLKLKMFVWPLAEFLYFTKSCMKEKKCQVYQFFGNDLRIISFCHSQSNMKVIHYHTWERRTMHSGFTCRGEKS